MYIHNSSETLKRRTGARSQGSSLIEDHNSKYGENVDLALVTCIDVVELINTASKTYKTILMKLDIESSEYDVLEKLISTNTYHYISEIWVEWHSQYMKEGEAKKSYEKRQIQICKAFKDSNIPLHNWR